MDTKVNREKKMFYSISRELYMAIESELKSKKLAEAFSHSYEMFLTEIKQGAEAVFNSARQQNKYELRDELTKELATKADLKVEIASVMAKMREFEVRVDSRFENFEKKMDYKFEMVDFKLKLLVALIVIFSVLGPKLSQLIFSFLPF